MKAKVEVGVEFVLLWIDEFGDEGGGGFVGVVAADGLEFGAGQCHCGGVSADGGGEEFAGQSDYFSVYILRCRCDWSGMVVILCCRRMVFFAVVPIEQLMGSHCKRND